MTADELKKHAYQLSLAKGTAYAWLQELICDGFLDAPVSSADIVHRVAEKFGRKWQTSRVQVYMRKFSGIIHAVKPRGVRANYWVIASMPRSEAIQLIGKSIKVLEIEQSLFASELELKLQKSFAQELDELRGVFGKQGSCTAFLLRKILEKLLIISFRKSGKASLIEDTHKPGGLIGLESMIGLAISERVNSAPILTERPGLPSPESNSWAIPPPTTRWSTLTWPKSFRRCRHSYCIQGYQLSTFEQCESSPDVRRDFSSHPRCVLHH